jgi:hypothetical protein
MLKCPIHELPSNIVIDNFYARLARIASLEAKLDASQRAWDVATAAKAAAEKSAKAAATKAKKAEKALADANQGHIQREQAITKRLNQVLALASGKYLSAFFSCLLAHLSTC